jgi:hypothetical protein
MPAPVVFQGSASFPALFPVARKLNLARIFIVEARNTGEGQRVRLSEYNASRRPRANCGVTIVV